MAFFALFRHASLLQHLLDKTDKTIPIDLMTHVRRRYYQSGQVERASVKFHDFWNIMEILG